MNYDVKDIKLAKDGLLRIEWANQSMQVLSGLEAQSVILAPPAFSVCIREAVSVVT